MKKTVNINVGGFAFLIDEDAYEILKNYLEKLNIKYKNSDSGKEIINDIEARIAELLRQKITSKEVISIEDVEEIVKQLGTPDEFEDEENNENNETKADKRVYRNPDDRILGGVCGGLGNYLGINPNIIRVIFVFAFAAYSAGLLVYILFWIILPEAKTTSQKLEMRGEKIDVKSIEKSIKSEFNSVKTNFQKWRNSKNGENTKQSFDKFLNFVSSIIIVCFKIFVVLVGIFFVVIGLIVIISLISIPFINGTNIGHSDLNFTGLSFFEIMQFFGSKTNFILGYIGVLLTAGIPMLALIYLGISLLLNFKGKGKWIGFTMLAFWILGILLSIFSTFQIIKNYAKESTKKESYIIENKSDTLFLYANFDEDFLKKYSDLEKIYFEGKYIYLDDENKTFILAPNLDIQKSETDNIELLIEYSARGFSRKDANDYCKKISYDWIQQDSAIYFNSTFNNSENNKWHGEIFDIIVKIPVNKYVYIGDNMNEIIFDIDNLQNTWDEDMIGKMWFMTKNGLTIADEMNVIEQNIDKNEDQNSDSVLIEMEKELQEF
jgi:phage shock protein PspC (stress-responsive transcriptional regulator)